MDWKKKALKAMTMEWAEEETVWRRDNVGKVRFYLVNASDDPPTFSDKGQVDLRHVINALKENNIEINAPFMTVDAVDAVGGYTGEISVLAQAFGPILAAIFGAWMQSKSGRKVRLKDGDIEVEARTVEEVGKLFDIAETQRQKRYTTTESGSADGDEKQVKKT